MARLESAEASLRKGEGRWFLDDRSHQGAATGAEPQPAQWRNRIEYDTADLKVFANLDASLSALNTCDIFT